MSVNTFAWMSGIVPELFNTSETAALKSASWGESMAEIFTENSSIFQRCWHGGLEMQLWLAEPVCRTSHPASQKDGAVHWSEGNYIAPARKHVYWCC